MPVHIDRLHVTVRVRTRPRAVLSRKENDMARRAPGSMVHVMPPPQPKDAAGHGPVAAMADREERPAESTWNVEQVSLTELSERVYEFVRYDVRVDRERRG